MNADTLQGLHLFMVHNPDEAIRRVGAMPNDLARPAGRRRWHKLITHNSKADWLARMPADTCWVIRNVEISEEPITAANAERLGRDHARVHAETLRNYVRAGISPDRLAFEGRNEPQPAEFPHVAAYEVARTNEAEALGVPSLVVGVFSVGQPWTYGTRRETAADWTTFDPMHRRMRPTDFLGLHGYYGLGGPWEVWPDGHLRWVCEGGRHLMCPWDVPMLFTEAGIDDGVNGNAKVGWWGLRADSMDLRSQQYVAMIEWADRQYLADERVRGVMLFTYDYENNEWERFNTAVNPFWEHYAAYIRRGIDFKLWGDRRTARWQPVLEHWAGRLGVDAQVLATLVALESGGDAQKVSATGATGLTQVLPGVAGLDRETLLHPDRNVEWGAGYLAQSLAAFDGDTERGIAGYLLGIEHVRRRGLSSATAQGLLRGFARTWTELWPGLACPLEGQETFPGVLPPQPIPTPDPSPERPADATIRAVAWASLYPAGGIPYAPAHALPATAHELGLAQALTREVRFHGSGVVADDGLFILQGFDGSPGAILWTRVGAWQGIESLSWL